MGLDNALTTAVSRISNKDLMGNLKADCDQRRESGYRIGASGRRGRCFEVHSRQPRSEVAPRYRYELGSEQERRLEDERRQIGRESWCVADWIADLRVPEFAE
jgi:hypothetical protein